ncbi:MAG TPA: sulfite oxidase, partial [Candidatus Dormibacteraeota bacterium]|nr:sulfite oxidase [Candidatus Dormibacteraeota bacterium]
RGDVVAVEVSTDAGMTWDAADLDAPVGVHAWRGWSFVWHATEGEHELCCRATDSTGARQPLEAVWNLGGYANNAVHRVPVTVAGV